MLACDGWVALVRPFVVAGGGTESKRKTLHALEYISSMSMITLSQPLQQLLVGGASQRSDNDNNNASVPATSGQAISSELDTWRDFDQLRGAKDRQRLDEIEFGDDDAYGKSLGMEDDEFVIDDDYRLHEENYDDDDYTEEEHYDDSNIAQEDDSGK